MLGASYPFFYGNNTSLHYSLTLVLPKIYKFYLLETRMFVCHALFG